MTPYEKVLQHWSFPKEIKGIPFDPHPLQIACINAMAPLPTEGHWNDVGTGKTFISTACALYQIIAHGDGQVLIILPPLLITQWVRWLQLIRPAVSITPYRGTPKERAALSLDNDFIVVGIQIFKKDYARFKSHFEGKHVVVIIDEANFIAKIGSDAHDKVYEFCQGRERMPLTGTAVNKPGDAYGLMKFSAPGVYRNLKHFENEHVDERDFFKNPIKWKELDKLRSNLMTNAHRILYRDMHQGVALPLYVPLEYELDPKHQALYRRLAEQQLLLLPDGSKIDATTIGRLIHALGQLVLNTEHFSGGELTGCAGMELIEEKLAELGDQKLLVFANYRMTVAKLVKAFVKQGAVGINSEVTAAQKQRNLERFVDDPSCRLAVIQFLSGGKGLDGLQHVCHHALFIEPCLQPRDFHQAVGRLDRTGQRQRVWVGMAQALKTLQVRNFKSLLDNDDLVNRIIRNPVHLRSIIFGEEDSRP